MHEDDAWADQKFYLLSWPLIRKEPTFCEVEIVEVQDLDGGDQWVRFTYGLDHDSMAGLEDGCPGCNILTEKEKDWALKTWAAIDTRRTHAKRMNEEAKHAWGDFLGMLTKRRVGEDVKRDL